MRSHPGPLPSRSLFGLGAGEDGAISSLDATGLGLMRRRSVFSIQSIGNAASIVDLVICLLSFVGSLFIILPYMFSKNSRKLRHALIVGLATSDLVASIVVIISTTCLFAGVDLTRTRAFCGFLGYMLFVSVFSQHLWNLAIATVTYMILIHPLSSFTLTVERRLVWLWPLFWGFAFFVHGIAWIWSSYSYVGRYCTMNSRGAFTAVFLFVPRGIVTVVIVILYTHLFFFLRRTNLFKAVSNISGSQQHSGSKTPRQHTSSSLADDDGRAANIPSRQDVGTGSGGVDGDGLSFATAPYITASSNSSTIEGIAGSTSSKRSLRPIFLSAANQKRDAVAASEGEVEVIAESDDPRMISKRRTSPSPRPPTIELQEFSTSSTLDQRHARHKAEAGAGAEVAERASTAVLDKLLWKTARQARSAEGEGLSSRSPQVEAGRAGRPQDGLVDSPPSSSKGRMSRDSLYSTRSASDPPTAAGLQAGLAAASSATGTEPIGAGRTSIGSTRSGQGEQTAGASVSTIHCAVGDPSPAEASASDAGSAFASQPGQGDGTRLLTSADWRLAKQGGPSSSFRHGRGPLSPNKRPSTTESYQTRAPPPPRYADNSDSSYPSRTSSSSHTYMVGDKAGRRMLMRRASFGDLSEGSDEDEDLYSFRPMRPRKDVSDFDMVSAPREHLKHLNAPKIWANMGEMLAMGDDHRFDDDGAAAAAGSKACQGGPVDGSVVIPMPHTERDFEQTLGADWSWGMDVTSPRTENIPCGGRPSSAQKGGSRKLLQGGKVFGRDKQQQQQSAGQGSNITTASSSSDGQGVDSLGSTLNRQASLLMLLYPAAYVLLFSLSIIRIIDDLANDTSRSRSQEVLHTLSRWFIFAQGLLDAIIFQFIERQFRMRMKRRRRRAMGEWTDDPFWTKVGKDTMRLVRRAVGRQEKPSPEAEEMTFRRGTSQSRSA